MFWKTLVLFLLLAIPCNPTFGQNTTMPLENTRQSDILEMQNQLFAFQKISRSLQQQVETLSMNLEELRQASSTHGQDILKALDAINGLNASILEINETVSQELAAMKTTQTAHAKHFATLRTGLEAQKKELLAAIDKQKNMVVANKDLLIQKNAALETTIEQLQKTTAHQDEQIVTLQKKIVLLENGLTGQQQAIGEIEAFITSQKAKTLGHLSSLENINATLSGLQQQSRMELENIHQSLTQVVIYGLLTIVGVTFFLVVILIIMRRKSALPPPTDAGEAARPAPVREEDDEILDWLKQKDRE
ncbi:hypothetical protein [Desulfoplanes formicivorans]|uniref:Uncharacterized protein n=1 Tax=Desulfoplanes formicivorans TaxID=1592317 RepID=A0A194AIJ8_9BACT|nr:hypothetical protein [Desulfoplanes formicivorans]GAU09148.1 hypothetical protein DPF_1868 [Desulfoplanes formicivorans]